MIDRINSLFNIFDVGDLRFFILVAKKNIKNLIILATIVSSLVYIISANQEKQYLSKATIVISPEEKNIVNIEKLFNRSSSWKQSNSNFKSDEFKNVLKTKKLYEWDLYSKNEQIFSKNIYKKML